MYFFFFWRITVFENCVVSWTSQHTFIAASSQFAPAHTFLFCIRLNLLLFLKGKPKGVTLFLEKTHTTNSTIFMLFFFYGSFYFRFLATRSHSKRTAGENRGVFSSLSWVLLKCFDAENVVLPFTTVKIKWQSTKEQLNISSAASSSFPHENKRNPPTQKQIILWLLNTLCHWFKVDILKSAKERYFPSPKSLFSKHSTHTKKKNRK